MTSRLAIFPLISVLLVSPNLSSQTSDLLNAEKVQKQLQGVRLEGKSLQYAMEKSDNFYDLTDDKLFLFSGNVKIVYPDLNPLRIDLLTPPPCGQSSLLE